MEQHRDEIRRLMIGINVLDGLYAMAAKQVGMNENALTLFYALDDGKKHSQIVISREWMIPKTTLNTIVKHSVAAGLITLELEAHSREKLICLTEAGRAFARKALNVIYAWEERAYVKTLQEFSPEFVAALSGFADQMTREAASSFKENYRHDKHRTEPSQSL